MTRMTTLLVARDPAVINDIQRLHDETDDARLEVCGRLDRVLSRLGHRTLLLVHLEQGADLAAIRVVLASAGRSSFTAVVVSGSAPMASPTDLGSSHTYHLPNDLPALRGLLANAQGVPDRPPAADSLGPIDPLTAAMVQCELIDDLPRIHRVAAQDTTVLLTGETGSGKSMLAKYLHGCSRRRENPYLVVDCGALSGQLIESEMFGHVRGAFTGAERERQGKFAAAGTGTLVLDEINSLPLPLQAKLLRAVEERVFEAVGSNKSEPLKARLVAVTNVPLEEEIRKERFRPDLYYRLNVVEFRLPPLRERPAAVVPLAYRFLRESATAACHGITGISPAALDAMLSYRWPGNVRELRNVIERASALAAGTVIQISDLPDAIRGPMTVPVAFHPAAPVYRHPSPEDAPFLTASGGDEATRIMMTLRKHNNNRRRAAAELGMSRMSLYKKLHKYGLFVRKGARPAAEASRAG
jgi:DNA-binding NtrC family response regulator